MILEIHETILSPQTSVEKRQIAAHLKTFGMEYHDYLLSQVINAKSITGIKNVLEINAINKMSCRPELFVYAIQMVDTYEEVFKVAEFLEENAIDCLVEFGYEYLHTAPMKSSVALTIAIELLEKYGVESERINLMQNLQAFKFHHSEKEATIINSLLSYLS